MKLAAVGLGLTALVGGSVWLVSGRDAALAAGLFGFLAAAVHVVAVAVLRPALVPPFERAWVRWAAGVALRMAGAAALAVAVVVAPERFPPLATALGFLGVLIPLLFHEMYLLAVLLRTAR